MSGVARVSPRPRLLCLVWWGVAAAPFTSTTSLSLCVSLCLPLSLSSVSLSLSLSLFLSLSLPLPLPFPHYLPPSLSLSLPPSLSPWGSIIDTRRGQANFQLIIITHEEEFVGLLARHVEGGGGGSSSARGAGHYFRVFREEE